MESKMSDKVTVIEVKVIEQPARHLVGMKIRTNMRNAQAVCPALWQTFGPRMGEVKASDVQGSYGVCIMLNADDFDYWAAVEAPEAASLPSGMESMELPGGVYAKAAVPSLEQLGEAYTYLYDTWLKGQTGYAASLGAPCFEHYPPNWQINDAFDVYMPLVKA
ncbi:hypothetical protein C4J81_14795 [Deltaproteobacteria bacterium Smac51]|nr:hypothetical protein C4J81_14795 [Deltaproteobacteria bacterium Smac51]